MDQAEAAAILELLTAECRDCSYDFFADRLTRGPLVRRVRARSGVRYAAELHVEPLGAAGAGLRAVILLEPESDLGGRPLQSSFLVRPGGHGAAKGGPSAPRT
jgi:hypothetical protein